MLFFKGEAIPHTEYSTFSHLLCHKIGDTWLLILCISHRFWWNLIYSSSRCIFSVLWMLRLPDFPNLLSFFDFSILLTFSNLMKQDPQFCCPVILVHFVGSNSANPAPLPDVILSTSSIILKCWDDPTPPMFRLTRSNLLTFVNFVILRKSNSLNPSLFRQCNLLSLLNFINVANLREPNFPNSPSFFPSFSNFINFVNTVETSHIQRTFPFYFDFFLFIFFTSKGNCPAFQWKQNWKRTGYVWNN